MKYIIQFALLLSILMSGCASMMGLKGKKVSNLIWAEPDDFRESTSYYMTKAIEIKKAGFFSPFTAMFQIFCDVNKEKLRTHGIRVVYAGEDWMFADELSFKFTYTDGSKETKSIKSITESRDVSAYSGSAITSEYVYFYLTDELIKDLLTSEAIHVRLGGEMAFDKVLTDDDIRSVRQYYKELGAILGR